MLTLIAAAALGLTGRAPTTIDLEPVENVWVYSHASDPTNDPYLRCWGGDGKSVAPNAAEAENFSYSYLQFDLSSLPKNFKLNEAKLILTHIPKPAYSLDVARANPLEVRSLPGTFTEKTWTFENVTTLSPKAGVDGMYGWASPEKLPTDDQSFTISIDLLKTDTFKTAIAQYAKDSKPMPMALTSSIDPESKAVYKLYSRYGPTGKHPVLHLVLEN